MDFLRETLEMCPVCGHTLSDTLCVYGRMIEYRGRQYFCCSPEHKKTFEADPERYLRQWR